MATESIELPDIPANGDQFEDYVAALFQCGGYFVQRGVTERDPTDVLELDAVVTDYDVQPPEALIVEAKSGTKWGYPDLFKVVGWLRYLHMSRGCFLVQTVPRRMDFAKRQARAAGLDVALVHLEEPDLTAGFVAAGFSEAPTETALNVWRFSYLIERSLLTCIHEAKKNAPTQAGPRAIWDYYNLINNSLFFEPDDYERVTALYAAFGQHPKLALGVAREIGGGGFDCEAEDPKNPQIRDALYRCAYPVLQACIYFEHRARLAILKAVVDIVLLAPAPKVILKAGDSGWTQLELLPVNIRQAVETLRAHPAVRHYPRFWQVFLWGCGGFLLRDREDDEFRWLSTQTGVPVEEMGNALSAFDVCFPLNNGGSWLTDAYDSQCRVVRMVPCVYQGLGVYHRMAEWGMGTVADFGYTDYTQADLLKWQNAAFNVMKQYSGLPVTPKP
ncbi:MAG: hypothetical protein R2910_05565 [Gemmatimonadales bacterium]